MDKLGFVSGFYLTAFLTFLLDYCAILPLLVVTRIPGDVAYEGSDSSMVGYVSSLPLLFPRSLTPVFFFPL
jgi:hypothetical protein